MEQGTAKLDMLHGSIWDKLLRFALPVAATAALGQLFNAADVAVVGNFASGSRTAAVAAVGANGPIINLILGLFIGIALGATVVIANAIGNNDRKSAQNAVHTSLVMAVVGGVIVAIIGELIAGSLLNLLQVPEDVYPLSLLYLRIYFLGMPAILLYNFEAAIFRSIGETKVPLIALAASGVLNVLLNLLFVIGFHMTVNGVAIATVLSNVVSSILLYRCSNNYGPYHFPEKLIPLMIANALNDKPLPVYGEGINVRDWLYVEDHCRAIDLIVHNGNIGEVYNVGGHNEMRNIDIVKLICKALDKPESLIVHVADRKGHDMRYAIDPTKIHNELGWLPETKFSDGISKTIEWYLANRPWWEHILSGDYQNYYQKMYGKRLQDATQE